MLLLLAQDVPLAEAPLPDAVLAVQRGGFALPNGIDVALTVQTQTTLNGAIVLRSVFRADQGPPSLQVYAPRPGTTVLAQDRGQANTAGLAQAPTVTYDSRTGIQVTQGWGGPTIGVQTGTSAPDALPAGLDEVAAGAAVATANGVVSQAARNGVQTAQLQGADLTITHLAGNAFGSAIANAGSDRAIDTQTIVGIDLRNAGPDVLGSSMLRVEEVAIDAMRFPSVSAAMRSRLRTLLLAATCLGTAVVAAPAFAQDGVQRPSVQSQLDAANTLIRTQQERLDAQEARLRALEQQLNRAATQQAGAPPQSVQPPASGPPQPAVLAAQAGAPGTPGDPAGVLQPPQAPLERVGQAPEDEDRPIELAVLDSQGSIVTRRGQLTGEFQLDYARADRNRAVFRGIELVEAVLVGVFDINESRQDVVTGSAALRYGLTDRLELGVRVPLIRRSDTSIIAPISGSTGNDAAATIDNSVNGTGIGDIEVTARYQVLDGGGSSPYLIANLQGVIPTGSDPFAIPRDDLGRAQEAATGAGFWGIAPSFTAILPSDPVVLFGTVGYTFNLGKGVDTLIPPVVINYVDPGDAVSGSAGIGISFNQRTTLNLGYAHSWAFGTLTRTNLLEPTPEWPGMRDATSRDLQIGRFLFGVTYRLTDRASLNWSVEVGATEDATDLRTVLRVPFVLLTGL